MGAGPQTTQSLTPLCGLHGHNPSLSLPRPRCPLKRSLDRPLPRRGRPALSCPRRGQSRCGTGLMHQATPLPKPPRGLRSHPGQSHTSRHGLKAPRDLHPSPSLSALFSPVLTTLQPQRPSFHPWNIPSSSLPQGLYRLLWVALRPRQIPVLEVSIPSTSESNLTHKEKVFTDLSSSEELSSTDPHPV